MHAYKSDAAKANTFCAFTISDAAKANTLCALTTSDAAEADTFCQFKTSDVAKANAFFAFAKPQTGDVGRWAGGAQAEKKKGMAPKCMNS